MRLREGTAVLWRGPGVLQVGADPDDHLVLESLSSTEVAWLFAAATDAVTSAPTTRHRPTPLPPLPRLSLLPERLRSRGFLREEPSGTPLVNGLRLMGVDTVTLSAARLLVQMGVRRFDLVDPRAVDLALCAALPDDTLGTPRQSAGAAVLRGTSSGVFVGALSHPDLVVVSTQRSSDASTSGLLMAEDRPHLLVTQRERSVVVGPLVVPGRTACAHCAELHLTDRDPRWPFLIEEASASPLPPPPALAAHVAALEVARVVAAVGQDSAPERLARQVCGTRVVRVGSDGARSVEQVLPHPRCGCGASGTVFEPVHHGA